MSEADKGLTRRQVLSGGCRLGALLGLGGAVGLLTRRAFGDGQVWQIDPHKCVQCGRCATACVLAESAVKCVHQFQMCGACDFCSGFFLQQPNRQTAAAENQLCPTGAIRRTYIDGPYYEYVIDERLCIGCARCVKGCYEHGNGSLFLQVRHDRCLNCNQCAIAAACPSDAFRKVPAGRPYVIKGKDDDR